MDLRIERTKRNIINAFIELRAKRPIEKITVKELAEAAVINKATFYLHYKDIYDLSDQLEDEVLAKALAAVPTDVLLQGGATQLTEALAAQGTLFNTLFSGSRADVAVHKLDHAIKERIFAQRPEWREDLAVNIKLTVLIYGGFHAYFRYQQEDFDTVLSALNDFSSGVTLG